jgi:hypothetical protein
MVKILIQDVLSFSNYTESNVITMGQFMHL